MKLFIAKFPDDLHKLLKIRAIENNKTMYQLIIDILRDYIGLS